ncbi:hypothetical protein QBC44DRAFT_303166, partial [Cladorrhinum sp. PSN332]
MKLSIALALGLAALPELASASFASTCRNWYWMDAKYLVAECKKANQVDWLRTRHDMNLCIGQTNQLLVPMNGGNAFVSGGDTCSGNSLTGTTLSGVCQVQSRAGFVWSSIDL